MSEPEAQTRLREALAGKRVLLILDDVWHVDAAAALNVVSAPSRLLITTRKREVLVGLGAQELRMDVLGLPEALLMLADWAGVEDVARLPPEATDVAQECGYLPLALAMIGAIVRLRPTAWADALEFLRSHDLDEFRRTFPDYPYPDLLRAIAVSVDELSSVDHERYLDLAVFPEDEPIPEGALQALWDLTPAKTRACMDRLAAGSLAAVQQVGGKAALLLHDLQGDYIRKQREKQLPALHACLLNAYATRCEVKEQKPEVSRESKWSQGPDDGYFFQRLAWHLKQADQYKELRVLLLDFNWLQAKLEATDVVALIRDHEYVRDDEELCFVEAALRLSAPAISRDKNQLAAQLMGRLGHEQRCGLRQLLASAANWRGAPWLSPLHTSLHLSRTALLAAVPGHTKGVRNAAVSADGDRVLVCSGREGMLEVWDLGSGRTLRTLGGPVGWARALAVSGDGRRAICGTDDGKLTVWDLENGRELRTLRGHTHAVTAAEMSADGRKAVCGDRGGTLKVWDVESGRELLTLEGHSASVTTLALSADGRRVVSASDGGTFKVWDSQNGEELLTLTEEADFTSIAVSGDGRRALLVEACDLLTEWDLETGCILRKMKSSCGLLWGVAPKESGWRAVGVSENEVLERV